MGLGILEDTKLEHVPGTALLADLHSGPQIDGVDSSLLKHDPSAENIILVPQPSNSPNDPYNWSKSKKLIFALAFTYCCGVVGGKFYSKVLCLCNFLMDYYSYWPTT